MPKTKFYAVASGRTTGIYTTWADCQAQVDGYSKKARFKSFRTHAEAQFFLDNNKPAAVAASADASSTSNSSRSSSINRTNGTRAAATKTQQSSASVVPPSAKRAKTSSAAGGTKIAITFDGGARGNPGVAGAGATVTICSNSSRKVLHIREYVGDCCTNNEAEYQGLVAALRVAEQEAKNETGVVSSLIVQGDSNLILQQLQGAYQVRSDKLKGRNKQAKDLLQTFSQRANCRVSLEHVYRSENKAADALANQAMDARRSWITTSEDNHEEQLPLDSYSAEIHVVHI